VVDLEEDEVVGAAVGALAVIVEGAEVDVVVGVGEVCIRASLCKLTLELFVCRRR
jgi:hypothetical protein